MILGKGGWSQPPKYTDTGVITPLSDEEQLTGIVVSCLSVIDSVASAFDTRWAAGRLCRHSFFWHLQQL